MSNEQPSNAQQLDKQKVLKSINDRVVDQRNWGMPVNIEIAHELRALESDILDGAFDSPLNPSPISPEQREEIQLDLAYINWFDEVAGTRDLTTAEIKRYVATEKALKISYPLLLSSEQALQNEVEVIKIALTGAKVICDMADAEATEHRERWQNELEISEQVVQEREELIIENESLKEQLNQAAKSLKRIAVGSIDGESRFIAGQALAALSQGTEEYKCP